MPCCLEVWGVTEVDNMAYRDLPASKDGQMRTRKAQEARALPSLPDSRHVRVEAGATAQGEWDLQWPLGQARTNVFGSHSVWPSQLRHKLLCIQSHFNDIVEQGKHRCQGKGGHKEGDETKLDD